MKGRGVENVSSDLISNVVCSNNRRFHHLDSLSCKMKKQRYRSNPMLRHAAITNGHGCSSFSKVDEVPVVMGFPIFVFLSLSLASHAR